MYVEKPPQLIELTEQLMVRLEYLFLNGQNWYCGPEILAKFWQKCNAFQCEINNLPVCFYEAIQICPEEERNSIIRHVYQKEKTMKQIDLDFCLEFKYYRRRFSASFIDWDFFWRFLKNFSTGIGKEYYLTQLCDILYDYYRCDVGNIIVEQMLDSDNIHSQNFRYLWDLFKKKYYTEFENRIKERNMWCHIPLIPNIIVENIDYFIRICKKYPSELAKNIEFQIKAAIIPIISDKIFI